MVNSRAKGNRRELEFAKLLTAKGYPAERGAQRSGSRDSPDIRFKTENDNGATITTVPPLFFEVKGVERLNIEDALLQAEDDSGLENIPVVAHIKNRDARWKVTLDAEDFLDYFVCFLAGRKVKLINEPRLHARPARRITTSGKRIVPKKAAA